MCDNGHLRLTQCRIGVSITSWVSLPLQDCETLTALEGDTVSPGGISLPYSVPLTPYGSQDKPWLADTSHHIPDINGAMVKHGRSR